MRPGRQLTHGTSEYFDRDWLILAPSPESALGGIEWAELDLCLWEAPLYLETKYPLKALYESAGLGAHLEDMRQFFQGTLRVPDISHNDVIEELKCMREDENGQNVSDVYRLIQKMHAADNSISGNLK